MHERQAGGGVIPCPVAITASPCPAGQFPRQAGAPPPQLLLVLVHSGAGLPSCLPVCRCPLA